MLPVPPPASSHEATYRRVSLTALVEEVRPELDALRHVLCFDDWSQLVADGRARTDQPLPTVDPATPFQIQYTSGTTGFAKGALLHHRGAVNAARYSAERAGFAEGDCWVNPIPLFHVGGGVLTGVGALYRHGVHVVVPAFDPASCSSWWRPSGPTCCWRCRPCWSVCSTTPTVRRDCSNLRTVMSGSTVVPAELVRRTRAAWDCDFSILFGQTELHGVLTQTLPTDDDEDQATTLGIPLPHVEVKIADTATGHPVPIGMSGEICARGYQSMLGYFEMADATAVALDADGWLHTGDLGSMDGRGYLRITGRLKDLIIRGGENIHPREIEDLLAAHPAIAEVAVIGVADPTWGEQVGAVLRLHETAEPPTAAALFAYCREHLAPFKTPRSWYVVDEFPLTPSGKIQKFVLRDDLASLRTLKD
ncbi:MAG: AMP-binding protein [Acidimicrobiales bacterium]